jgi:hypothetical protein
MGHSRQGFDRRHRRHRARQNRPPSQPTRPNAGLHSNNHLLLSRISAHHAGRLSTRAGRLSTRAGRLSTPGCRVSTPRCLSTRTGRRGPTPRCLSTRTGRRPTARRLSAGSRCRATPRRCETRAGGMPDAGDCATCARLRPALVWLQLQHRIREQSPPRSLSRAWPASGPRQIPPLTGKRCLRLATQRRSSFGAGGVFFVCAQTSPRV